MDCLFEFKAVLKITHILEELCYSQYLKDWHYPSHPHHNYCDSKADEVGDGLHHRIEESLLVGWANLDQLLGL